MTSSESSSEIILLSLGTLPLLSRTWVSGLGIVCSHLAAQSAEVKHIVSLLWLRYRFCYSSEGLRKLTFSSSASRPISMTICSRRSSYASIWAIAGGMSGSRCVGKLSHVLSQPSEHTRFRNARPQAGHNTGIRGHVCIGMLWHLAARESSSRAAKTFQSRELTLPGQPLCICYDCLTSTSRITVSNSCRIS